jgi:HEPN domain-containing protein
MNAPDSSIMKKVRQWIAYGNADLRMALHGFSLGENAPFHLIAYHAQQAVEKYLKGYLVFFGLDVPYTHNLIRIMSLCPEHDEWEGNIQEIKFLTQYSISTRYPGVDEEVAERDAREAVEIARRAIHSIRSALIKKGIEFTDEEREQ